MKRLLLFPKTFSSWCFLLLRWLLLFSILFSLLQMMTDMPGRSYENAHPKLNDEMKEKASRLEKHVMALSHHIGSRNIYLPEKMEQAVSYIRSILESYGLYVREEPFSVEGKVARNLFVTITGKNPNKMMVVGAHYDTVITTPGADDNASGVAGLLEIAKSFADQKPDITLKLIAFANEEPPFFGGPFMGSMVSAKKTKKDNETIIGMVALEMLGFFSDEKGSQKYPFPYRFFYPDQGNFIAFVSNISSRHFLKRFVKTFREECAFPSEGLYAPGAMKGTSWSDHRSYWEEGYPAIMITDTSFFRYPFYHKAQDTYEKLNYSHMARVVEGIERVLAKMIL